MKNKTKRMLEDAFHEAYRALNVDYFYIHFFISNAECSPSCEINASAFALAMMQHKGITEKRFLEGFENVTVARVKEIML